MSSPGQLKKLDRFKDENAPMPKRLKAFQSFLDHASEAETQKVFKDHLSKIYQLVLKSIETWNAQVQAARAKGKMKVSQNELFGYLSYLKMVLDLQPEMIASRWQAKSIGTLMEGLLVQDNKHVIRLAGYELLLMYLADMDSELDEVRDKKFITFFKCTINFQPFLSSYDKPRDIVLENPVITGPKPCSPSPTPASQKESCELLERLLDFMSNEKQNFGFWLGMLKKYVLTTCYPSVMITVGIKDQNNQTGFLTHCPYDIQSIFVARLVQWIQDPSIFSILCCNSENVTIILEIFRQSFELPISFANTIQQSLDMYKSWVGGKIRSPLMQEMIQHYLQQFISHLAVVFDLSSTPEQIPALKAKCCEILDVFKFMANQSVDMLDEDTWYLLLNTLVDISDRLLSNTKPASSMNSLTWHISNQLMTTLFEVYILSQTPDLELWERLSGLIVNWTAWKDVVSVWRTSFLQLTCMYCCQIYVESDLASVFMLYNIDDVDHDKIVEVINKRTGDSSVVEDQNPLDKKKKESLLKFLSSYEEEELFKWESEIGLEITQGLNLDSQRWDKDTLEYIWMRLFRVLGNPCHIEEVSNNIHAMKGVEKSLDIFLKFDRVCNRRTMNIIEPHLLVLYAPWLFEACFSDTSETRSIAYGSLCRLFCRRFDEPDESILNTYLSHFYTVIHEGLTGEDKAVIVTIIANSADIFGYCYSGINVLVPDYLRSIRKMMNMGFTPAPPEHVRKAAIQNVCSLICFPNHYADIQLPDLKYVSILGEQKSGDDSQIKSVPFIELKNSIASLLFTIAKDEYFVSTKSMCIWGLCVQIIEELHHTPKDVVVVKCVKMLMNLVSLNEEAVAKTATEAFSALTFCYEKLRNLDSSIITVIIDGLYANIIDRLQEKAAKSKEDETIISGLFYCLTEWIMCDPITLLSDSSLSAKVFESIEYGLFGQKIQTESGDPRVQMATLMQKRTMQESEEIRDAAEIALVHIFGCANTFPRPCGVHQFSSNVLEDEDHFEAGEEEVNDNVKYFILNDRSVFSLVEIPPTEESQDAISRVLVRDLTGKYSLDSKVRYDKFGDGDLIYDDDDVHPIPLERPESPMVKEDDNVIVDDKPPARPSKPPPRVEGKSSEEGDEMPRFGDDHADILEKLIDFAGDKYQFLQPSPCEPSIHVVDPSVPLNVAEDLVDVTDLMHYQRETEVEVLSNKEDAYTDYAIEKPNQEISLFHYCRTFLVNMGFITPDNLQNFVAIDTNQKLFRQIKALDNTPGRELLKIGVIFVQEGQDDQKNILRNDERTTNEDYENLLLSLGWKVDLSAHKGFMGLLDRNLTNGRYSISWANSTFEVMYHVVTMMPTVGNDPQQILKKRHVGNDIVHIVWSEHARDYRPNTITSQFNDAHIVTYPLPNGLYRIQVFFKNKLRLFGPLIDGMIVNRKLLAPLIRQTAINAYRIVRYSTEGYKSPYKTRMELIKLLVEKHKEETTFDGFLGSLFTPPAN